MLVRMPVGLNAMLTGELALLVKVTLFCTAVRMQPSGVASVSVRLMFCAVSLSSNGMTRAAMAGSFSNRIYLLRAVSQNALQCGMHVPRGLKRDAFLRTYRHE